MQINPEHFKEIYGLRAAAVVLVALYHTGLDYFSGGYVGVDIFFVVSGFVITANIESLLCKSDFPLLFFYSKRVRRLYPVLVTVIFLTIPFGFYLILPKDFNLFNYGLLSAVSGISNILYYFKASYFDSQSDFRPILHIWSLSLEIQFYLFFPIVYLFIKRNFDDSIRIVLLFVTIFLALSSLYISRLHHQFGFYMLPSRLFEFFAGSCAFIYRRDIFNNNKLYKIITLRSGEFLAVIGLIFLICGVVFADSKPPIPGISTIFVSIGTSLLLVFLACHKFLLKCLSGKWIVYLGAISYSFYLIHQPILTFPRLYFNYELPIYLTAFLIFTSVIVASLFYKYIEVPCRDIRILSNKNFYIGLFLMIASIVGIAYLALSNDGLKRRFDADYLDKIEALQSYPHGPLHDKNCDAQYPIFSTISACRLSSNSGPDILLLGDSHSHHYYPSMVNNLPNYSILNLGSWSCFPAPSVTHYNQRDCENNFLNLISFIERGAGGVRYIFLSGYWAYLQSGGFSIKNGYYKMPAKVRISETNLFVKKLGELLEAADRVGVQVILFRDIPDLNFSPASCIKMEPYRKGFFEACSMSLADYLTRQKSYDVAMRYIISVHPEVIVYDPVPLFCNNYVCRANDSKGNLLYYDSDHLSTLGAELVVRDFLSKITLR